MAAPLEESKMKRQTMRLGSVILVVSSITTTLCQTAVAGTFKAGLTA
jgi:hypothetical protein